MLRKIDRILLRVPNLQSAVRYYRDVLHMRLLRQDARIASFALEEGSGELLMHADPDLPAEAVYFLVDDVRDLYARREALKLTFIQQPAQVARGYRATVRDPFGNVMLLIDRSTEGSAPAGELEDAKPPGALFAGIEPRSAPNRELLIGLYQQIGRTADDLPYTPHFESLYAGYVRQVPAPQPTRREVWRHLLNLRKAGKLPKLGEARSAAPEVSLEDRDRLRRALGADIGRRDRLPYTDRFDQLVDEFNRTQPRPLSPHLLWRLVATIAK